MASHYFIGKQFVHDLRYELVWDTITKDEFVLFYKLFNIYIFNIQVMITPYCFYRVIALHITLDSLCGMWPQMFNSRPTFKILIWFYRHGLHIPELYLSSLTLITNTTQYRMQFPALRITWSRISTNVCGTPRLQSGSAIYIFHF